MAGEEMVLRATRAFKLGKGVAETSKVRRVTDGGRALMVIPRDPRGGSTSRE